MLTITSLKKLFPDWEEGLYEAIVKEAELKQAKAGDILLKMGQNIKSAMLVVE
jgi:CRP/FNR family transcriptional regulator